MKLLIIGLSIALAACHNTHNHYTEQAAETAEGWYHVVALPTLGECQSFGFQLYVTINHVWTAEGIYFDSSVVGGSISGTAYKYDRSEIEISAKFDGDTISGSWSSLGCEGMIIGSTKRHKHST